MSLRLLLLSVPLALSGCFLVDDYPGQHDPDSDVDFDGDGSFADVDCDDEDANNFPGNTEVCDGADNDCVDGPDADLAGETDADNDGFLSCAECDDTSAARFPENPEVCDGLDNDCDGTANFVDGDTAEADEDRDGYVTCFPFTDNGGAFDGGDDCDDGNPLAYPGADEICNGEDENCNFVVDDGFDLDGDTVTVCGADGDITTAADNDCDDDDVAVFPGATETCNAVDDDCDTVVDDGFDADGDNVTVCGADGDSSTVADNDCDDTDPLDFPGAIESCNADDEDCDGLIDDGFDIDTDGFTTCGADGDPTTTADNDCDDGDVLDFPGGIETCNGDDEDCDGHVDEGFDVDTDGFTSCGADGNPATTADNDCDDGDITAFPGATEVCDADLEDCNGTIDDGFDVDTDGFTTCGADGIAGNADDDCDDAAGTGAATFPGAPEVCDGSDNDCSGLADAAMQNVTDVPYVEYTLEHSTTSSNVTYSPLPTTGFCGGGGTGSAFTVVPTALDSSFTFEFYGETPTHWNWTADGAVDLLGPTWESDFHAQVMPSTSAPNGYVATWNANLDGTGLTHCWGMSGTAGNLIWYYNHEADYENPPAGPPPPPATHTQVQFHQFDNAIEVHFISAPPPPPGNPVTVGVENQAGSTAAAFASASTTVNATGEAIRFTPTEYTEIDHDGDGQLGCDECNDLFANAFVGGTEICGDAVDNDCDGSIDESCPP